MSVKYKNISLVCAVALGSSSVWAASPFPSVPYYMQSQTINRTKPNLVLLLDNSNSMGSGIKMDNKIVPRYVAARTVALQVFNEYKDRFRWGVAFLDEQTQQENNYAVVGYNNYDNLLSNTAWAADRQYYNAVTDSYVNGYWYPGFKGAGEGPFYYVNGYGQLSRTARTPEYKSNYCYWRDRACPYNYKYDVNGYINVPINDMGNSSVVNGKVIYDPISSAQEDNIKKYINLFYHTGNTPTFSALRTVYNYMSASDYSFAANSSLYRNYFAAGKNPTYAFDTTRDPSTNPELVMQYRCQKNYVVLVSDGEATDGDIPGAPAKFCQYPYSCRNMNFQDPDNPPLGYSAEHPWAMAYNKDYRPENYAYMKKDLDGQSWNDPYFPKQNIVTHTIGFGDIASGGGGSSTGEKELKLIASEAGGTYAAASDTTALKNALVSILNSAALETPNYIRYDKINFTNPAAVLSGNQSNSLIPIVTIDPDYWSSYIQFKQPDPTSPSGYRQNGNHTDIVAYPITASENNRTVLATIPNGQSSQLYDISRANLANVSLDNTAFNLDNLYAQEAGSNNPLDQDKWKDGYLPWLEGWDDRADNSAVNPWDAAPSYRDRTGKGTDSSAADADMRRHLGDVTRVDMAMMGPNITKPVSAFGASFTMPKFMVVQSNDGMVRIYSAASYDPARPYWERFAYIPGNADRDSGKFLNDLIVRARQNYKQGGIDHEYFMSGSVNYYSTTDLSDYQKQNRYFFIGTLGQGGKAAYALNVGGRDDVTGAYTGIDGNASSSTDTPDRYNPNDKTNVPLWDTSTTAFGLAGVGVHGLGYTISDSITGMTALSRGTSGEVPFHSERQYVTYLPNGYGYTGETKPVIYAIDTLGFKYQYDSTKQMPKAVYSTSGNKAGQVLQKIEITPAEDGAVLGGVSAVDYNNDGIVDALYVGDSNGSLYRVDLRKSGNLQYSVTKIFTGDGKHPITAAPSVAVANGARYIVFGTGRNYLPQDTITNDTKDEDIEIQTLYSIRDTAADSSNGVNQPNITYDNRDDYLQQKVLASASKSDGTQARSVTDGTHHPKDAYGWYIDLSIGGDKTGERVTAKPSVISAGKNATVYFNTDTVSFKLPANQAQMKCVGASANTASWIYQLDAATGNPPTKIYMDNFLDNGFMFAALPTKGDEFTLISDNLSAMNSSGEMGSSGVLPLYGLADMYRADNGNNGSGSGAGNGHGGQTPPPAPPSGCHTQFGGVISPTESHQIHVSCDNPVTVRRISWREITRGYF